MNNSFEQNHLIVLHGPTASGKTALAIELAHKLECDIISFDSRQFYREMSIGTAVPTAQELTAAKHYFIHDRSIQKPLSSGQYETEALELLNEKFRSSKYALIVGGSGLYATAITTGFDDLPRDENIRTDLNQLSLEELKAKLYILDPEFYNLVAQDNHRRVQRAVEVCLITGQKYSSLRTNSQKERPFKITEISIDRPRQELYNRINQRVDVMIAQGLELEARSLSPYQDYSALQTVGYREFFNYFNGTQPSIDEVVRLIKQNTRHYAKRQLTWLRSKPQITSLTEQQILDLSFL